MFFEIVDFALQKLLINSSSIVNTILLPTDDEVSVFAQDGFQFVGQDNVLIGFVGEEQLISSNFSIVFKCPQDSDKRCY